MIEERSERQSPFSHEALLYWGNEEFIRGIVSFVRRGLERAEPVLVVVSARKVALLQEALGSDAKPVEFADMSEIGSNPARIIPAWRDFIDRNTDPDAQLWGVGEPITHTRTADELVEFQLHEALLNIAFSESAGFNLLCPYDLEVLDDAVIDEAHATHTSIGRKGKRAASDRYRQDHFVDAPYLADLRQPPIERHELAFGEQDLARVRAFVDREAGAAGLTGLSLQELVFVANELATNSLLYGGGRGVLRLWREEESVVCEFIDGGELREPLVGRTRPERYQSGGRGLWLANQLCDLLQVRSQSGTTTIRLFKNL